MQWNESNDHNTTIQYKTIQDDNQPTTINGFNILVDNETANNRHLQQAIVKIVARTKGMSSHHIMKYTKTAGLRAFNKRKWSHHPLKRRKTSSSCGGAANTTKYNTWKYTLVRYKFTNNIIKWYRIKTWIRKWIWSISKRSPRITYNYGLQRY